MILLAMAFPSSIYCDVFEDSPTSLTISGSAIDADGDTISYSIVDKISSGTNWLTMAESGSLSGIPTNSDVGLNKWIVKAEDDYGGSDETTLTINVLNTNDPPCLNWNTSLSLCQGYLLDIDLTEYLFDMDPTTDTIKLDVLSSAKWITVNRSGRLLGIPSYTDIGESILLFRIEDNHGAFTESEVSIIVGKEEIIPIVNEIIFYNEF